MSGQYGGQTRQANEANHDHLRQAPRGQPFEQARARKFERGVQHIAAGAKHTNGRPLRRSHRCAALAIKPKMLTDHPLCDCLEGINQNKKGRKGGGLQKNQQIRNHDRRGHPTATQSDELTTQPTTETPASPQRHLVNDGAHAVLLKAGQQNETVLENRGTHRIACQMSARQTGLKRPHRCIPVVHVPPQSASAAKGKVPPRRTHRHDRHVVACSRAGRRPR